MDGLNIIRAAFDSIRIETVVNSITPSRLGEALVSLIDALKGDYRTDIMNDVEQIVDDIPYVDTYGKGMLPKVKTNTMIAGSASMPVPVWDGTKMDWSSLSVASSTANGIMTKEHVHSIDVLNAQMTAMMNKAEMTISFSTNVVEIGQTTNVTINGKLNSSNGMTADVMGIYESAVSGSALKTAANANTISVSRSVSMDSVSQKAFIVTATIAGGMIMQSANVYARYATYCGFGASASTVSGKNKRIVTSAAGTYTGSSTANGVKYYILVPTGTTVPTKFTMNATPFVMNNAGSMTIGNTSYTILESGSTFNTGAEVNIVAS